MKFILPNISDLHKRKIIIYGTGEVAKQYFAQILNMYEEDVVSFFMETKPLKKEFLGKPVYSPEKMNSIVVNDFIYLITSYSSATDISSLLIKKGINQDLIIMPNRLANNFYLTRDTGTLKNICFYPDITDNNQLNDIIQRTEWYLPVNSHSVFNIYLPTLLEVKIKNNYIKVVSPQKIKEYCGISDAILIWDKKSLHDEIIKHNTHRVYCVDPSYYSIIESKTYSELLYFTMDKDIQEYFLMLSKKNYEKMLNENKHKKEATIFCTGPSIEKAFDFNYNGHFKVICNSIIKNNKLLKHIEPDLLVFADPVFHFSPCEYSKQFREDAIKVIENYGCYCGVPEFIVPLMVAHYPNIKDKIIGIPMMNSVDFNFPNLTNFYTRLSSNILTSFMIPIASYISDIIYIIGCDGREKRETYFWKHNDSTQYSELMNTVFKMHESFFRDRVYHDYYQEHCEYLNQQLQYGENLGKNYYSLSRSFIPALRDRSI